ncbi:hypothetical protein A7K91_21900 [Paenibacillus oryzae]|uniref:Uncharacterized protein n=1 Tax=Paenibacillus oryzae TaxID=1844972 RepID=A0A1A5YMZ5_9BACL|nr:hypothetical protein [Paenibacillus oryzae]OBR66979.1 hypothetical protein A7K91_21900 [Paenibacillus oryzae]
MDGGEKTTIPVLLYRYKGPRRNIGFTLSPLYLNEASPPIETEQMLFIYNEDFEYIRPALDRVFPLADPYTGEMMLMLDPCWDNPIPKNVWTGVLAELEEMKADEPELAPFLEAFITWAKKQLDHADGIEVMGNL